MIGVIADDFTGAAELGAVGVRYGLLSEIVLSGMRGNTSYLICLDTDSRLCIPNDAGRRAVGEAMHLRESGASWIYKKVDSVLRGPVTAEVEALLHALGLNGALLVPANPAMGRAISGGEYFIGDRPIHETDFARDPDYPRCSPRVVELLAQPRDFALFVCRVNDLLPTSGIILGEARSPADLRSWAARFCAGKLPAGGAEFFAALLQANGHAQKGPSSDQTCGAEPDQKLFVCGSTSDASGEFVKEGVRQGTPVFGLPMELAHGANFEMPAAASLARQAVTALQTRQRVILHIGLPRVRDACLSRRLVTYLVEVAEAVLRQAGACHVFAEGGATAVTLARRLGWSRLKVLREECAGVATLLPEGSGGLWLTVKPGSYPWPRG